MSYYVMSYYVMSYYVMTNDFMNLTSSYSFFPMISKATRKQKQAETLLDNIFVNNLALYHSSGIIVEDPSDHLPVFMTLKIKKQT